MDKRYTVKERERLIELVRSSGEPVKVVAARMGVKESTAYFWMKWARASAAPTFARVVPDRAANPTVAIEVAGAIVRVEPGFDAALLLEVISVLAEQRS